MKTFLSIIMICLAINGQGQTEKPITKGNIILGGNAGFSFTHYRSENSFGNSKITDYSITLSPAVGYFIIDGLAIGISPNFYYGHSRNKYVSSDANYENSYDYYSVGISPFVKYYFKNCIFVGLETGYNYFIQKTPGSDYNNNVWSVKPSFGYAFFINPKISIEPAIGYSYTKSVEGNDNTEINGIFLSVGLHMFL